MPAADPLSATSVRAGYAYLAASLFAIDPIGTGGVSLRACPGPVRDAWLAHVRGLLPADQPWRHVPLHVADGRLLGGLDLGATLRSGRPMVERGLLAECDGGVVQLAMAERVPIATAARIAAVMDAGEIALERDGLALRLPTRFGVVALDEGLEPAEHPPAALLDRMAFLVDLSGLRPADGNEHERDPAIAAAVAAARERLAKVRPAVAVLEALCAAAESLGILSIRTVLLALRTARAAAALAGRTEIEPEDAAIGAQLVLAPRATMLPASEEPQPPEPPPSPEEASPPEANADDGSQRPPPDGEDDAPPPGSSLEDVVLAAAAAAIPPGLLALLRTEPAQRPRAGAGGRAGALQRSRQRGRPTGVHRGDPAPGVRLNVVETLRAAAPWQSLRRRERSASGRSASGRPLPRVEVRRDDFRVTRYKQHSPTVTIFAVDASGSSALHRLAEAKGAVELLLAECYVRRDRVALVGFRGTTAEVLLPPTRSLVRARRGLAGLPGGGGTPLAAGIAAAGTLAQAVAARGETPVLVLLTDGRANIARDGEANRTRAHEDAIAAARTICAAHLTTLLVDTSPRPNPAARQIAAAMNANYVALPHADAATLSQAVRTATRPPPSAPPGPARHLRGNA